jgi:hypothetical protein
MAIRYNKQYNTDAGLGREFIDNYNPLDSLLDEGSGGGGGSTGGGGGGGGSTGGGTVIPPTPPGNNIKLTLKNISKHPNQMRFDVQNSTYNENTQVDIDSNTINDSLVIKPIVSDTFIPQNYYQLNKTLVSKIIITNDWVVDYNNFGIDPASSLYGFGTSGLGSLGNLPIGRWVEKSETVQVPGITIGEYNSNNTLQGSVEYQLPIDTNLEFDLVQIENPKEDDLPKPTKLQKVYVTTNYDNSKLNDELQVVLNSKDLTTPTTLKIGNSIDIKNVNNSSSDLSVSISGLSSFKLRNIRWQYANKFDSNSTFNVDDFNILSSDNVATLFSNEFNANIILLIEVEPDTSKYASLILDQNTIDVSIAESIFESPTASKLIDISYNVFFTDLIKITTPYKEFTQAPSVRETLSLDLKNDFLNNEGSFKILFTPYSTLYGDGITQTLIVNISKILDIPVINKIDYPTSVYIPSYSFGDVNFSVLFESNLATHVLVYHAKEDDSTVLGKFSKKDSIKLNYIDLKNRKIINSPLDLLLIPYNGNIKGEIERITINFEDAGIYVSSQNLKDELFKAIAAHIRLDLDKSKYLNHLASFDIDDKQIIISNWDIDNTTFTKFKKDELGNDVPDGEINKSVVLKLYEPLPTGINKNDTLWISELSALPILQSVVLTGVGADKCVPLRAPNFDVNIDFVKEQSTGFESYDNLILSGSATSQQIVDKYLVENFIDVKGINIDYTNLSNFVKYSSAVERLANFKYKKELAEWYDNTIETLKADSTPNTIALNLDITNYQTKKTNLITGFDGWETYLTQSVFTGSFSNTSTVSLYNDYLDTAVLYDRNNNNSLKNNIPLHIVEDNANLDYLLFLDMVGNYFDIIWAYIKGMSDQKKIVETNTDGIEDKFLYQYLQSFGWNAKNLNSNKQLWEYTFGLNNNAETGSFTSTAYLGDNTEQVTPEKATTQIWRRIANNLPYLLKHKGSVRGINALLTCYGIAASNLSIMEFGGPTSDVVEDSPKFIYNSLTHNLVFDNITASLDIPFTGTPKPQAIEFKLKPDSFQSYTFITGSGDFSIGIQPDISNDSIARKYGYFTINGNWVSSKYPFYDGNYHSILLNKSGNTVNLYARTNDKDRITQSGEWITTITGTNYENTTTLKFTGFKGHLEEFRLWETNLSESVFNSHVVMPEAVNGNHLYSSTQDLLLRLDFERPQNVNTNTTINNVAPKIEYVAAVSASGFATASSYPYNYDVLEREVALTIPNSGASRYYTNKVRLESQELTSNLSPLYRSTIKAFENAPMDSNRVGLFFSPNKDLDLDIAKSFGGESFDEYIGNPKYEYGYINYPELDAVRNYYFERVGERNLYEFIRLIKFYDKSLFVNLREMLPARVIATTGLLIAPHLLERNRIKVNRPEATAESLEGGVTETQITELTSTFDYKEANLNLTASVENISGVNQTINGTLVASDIYNFNAEANSFTGIINTDLVNVAEGSYITYTGSIDYRRDNGTITTELDLMNAGQIVGMDNAYIDYGYGTIFNNGYGKYIYEENGVFKSKAIRAFLVTKKSTTLTYVNTLYKIDATQLNLPVSGGYIIYKDLNGNEITLFIDNTIVFNFYASEIVFDGLIGCTLERVIGSGTNVATSSYSQKLIVQDGAQLLNSASLYNDPNLSNTAPVDGYLLSHYIYKGDKHTSIENLFYKGCKQTTATTIDGKAAVETFTTNPTTLRVTAQGRSSNEPILEVD